MLGIIAVHEFIGNAKRRVKGRFVRHGHIAGRNLSMAFILGHFEHVE